MTIDRCRSDVLIFIVYFNEHFEVLGYVLGTHILKTESTLYLIILE